MLRVLLSVWFFVVTSPNLALSQTESQTPDVIGCLKAIETLDGNYRSLMQQRCASVALQMCMTTDEGSGSCLPDLSLSLRIFYSESKPLLPPTIEGSVFLARLYEHALKRISVVFEDLSECSNLSDYEFTTCEYLVLTAATLNLFSRARQANIPLP